jgi:PAS domain S-box-containing protein
MSKPAWSEAARLAALRQYEILDTPAEASFDAFTRLAAQICGTPMAAISLLDRDRQWFKSRLGLDCSETPRSIAFCDRAIRGAGPFVVPDAASDPSFRDNPLVTKAPHIRFYAGVPLVSHDGLPIGALCVMDQKPRALGPAETEALADLGRQVMAALELNLVRRRLERVLDRASGGFFTLDPEFRFTFANAGAARLLGADAGALPGVSIWSACRLADGNRLGEGLRRAARTGTAERFEAYHPPSECWLDVAVDPSPEGLTIHVDDITARRREELTQRTSNRILRLIALGGSLPVILRAVARSIGDISPGLRAAIMTVEGGATLKTAAASYLPPEFAGALDGLPVGPASGCCGTAVFRRELTIAADIDISPLWAGRLREHALAHGLRACWSMPLKTHTDGSVVATLAVYRDEPRGPGEADLALLTHFAKLATIGIEHVHREEALRESERRMVQLAENVDEVFWISKPDGKGLAYINTAYEKISGRKRDDLYRNPRELIDAIHPEDRLKINLAPKRFPDGSFANEYRLIRPDGGVRWIEDRRFPVRGGNGDTAQMVGIAKDVTDAKFAEARLRESEERFRIVAQTTADVVWDWNLLDDTVNWNAGLKQRFGHDPGPNAPSASWTDFIHPDDLKRVSDGIHAVINGRTNDWQDEYRFLHADGTCATVTDRGRVIRDQTGRAIRMVGSMVDVTERRQLEEQLRQAQRLDAVGKLTGGVAHDFNNILMVIAANVEALQEQALDGHVAEGLERISGATQRAAGLTRQLLAFSRKQTLQPEITNLNDLIAVTSSLLHRTLGGEIDIETRLSPTLGHTNVDRSQFESALVNLCVNARDAMPTGGRLTIETANVTFSDGDGSEIAPGDYVMLAVTDNGSGMAADVVSRAFDPFFTTKDVGKGSGLGLSMVYGFVRQSKGHVDIKSQVGWGTTVRIYLPLVDGDAEQSPAAKPVAAPRGKERILIVEDNEEVRGHVESMLSGLGYEVVSAASGREALGLLDQAGEIDLLFTDVVMPGGMNGREVADAARRARPNLRVLFTSGYAEGALQNDGRLAKGVLLLAKPYRKRDLAEKVREALSAAPASVEAAPATATAASRLAPAGHLRLAASR